MADEKFYSVDEAAERLALARAEVYRKAADGALKGEKRERRLCFAESELARYEEVVAAEGQALREALAAARALFGERVAAHGAKSEEEKPAEPAGAESGGGTEGSEPADPTTDEQVAELGDLILRDALLGGVSDLFLDPLHDGARLLSGPEGNRRELARFPAVLAGPLRDWCKGTAPLPAEGAVRDAAGQREVDGKKYQFRLQTVPTLLGELVHLHFFLDSDGTGLADLGYTAEQADALRELLSGRPGVLLLSGSSGPGTDGHRLGLARLLATEGRLVVALDRRTQYREERLVQLELASGEEGTADVWRTALAMRPNALCFELADPAGERRYLLEGVGAGALVVAQMSAGDALAALGALLADCPEKRALTRALLGVVEGTVLRRLCPHCRAMRPASAEVAGQLGLEPAAPLGVAVGCGQCGDGYLGRYPLWAVWPRDEELTAWCDEPGQADGPAAPAALSLAAAARRALLAGEIHWGEAAPYLAEGAD